MSESVHPPNPTANPAEPPPPTDPPVTGLATAQPTQIEPSSSSQDHGQVPTTSAPQTSTSRAPQPPDADPFSDSLAGATTAQPSVPREPPQHPDQPLPVGALTETPLHNEPAPILPPRPHESIQRVAMSPAQPQPIPSQPQAPVLDSNVETLESDPAIASLHAMFPDLDLVILLSVLEATGGDKDRAVDSLLAMSDPEYAQSQSPLQSQTTAGAGNQAQRTRTELDEEFARRLMLEEQQQANAGSWPPPDGQYTQSFPYQQYQPRRSGEAQRPPNAGGGFGEMAGGLQQQFRNFVEGATSRTGPGTQNQGASGTGYQQQFNKIADTGKKTFNTLFSKVKQKMAEFDNKNPPDTQHMNQPQQSGHWSSWEAPAPAQQHVSTYAQSPAGQQTLSMQSSPPPASHGALNSDDFPAISTNAGVGAGGALPSSSGRWQYQAGQPGTLPAETLPTGPAQSQPPPSGATASGSTEEPRRSIDASRLGLLPKRPVSLMDARPAQPQAAARARDSDEDSLEYVDRPAPGAATRT